MNKKYNSISKYDKNNNLIDYIEFTDDYQTIKCSYNVDGNILKRTYLQNHKVDESPCAEVLNSIIEYDNNIMLFSLHLDGETYLQPILSGNSFTSMNSVKVINSIFSCQSKQESTASIESFSIKSDLINDYLNKL